MSQQKGDEWTMYAAEMNETMLAALERNVEAQTQFVESWLDALEETPEMSTETISEGLNGYARAYEVWMNAAEQQFERASDAFEGEDVSANEFRDIWLNSANEAFKEVMGTSAFAAATGQTVEDALEMQREVDEAAQSTLRTLGFATEGDIDEVAERLVELERRQHAVETKLDRLLDAMDVEG
ncbi:poly(R)-hydroxyalkanoic acid synthase subunit (plasmid) [Haloferax mediterranei ATCC 33500]|uniref:Poly(3-hydroxyalkanoate) polymerase subunit PhaE n=2 Tax=Haloferax mediterranei (strain ATCC 33500 / DSM 1411 / JCM 8866 / NBRC 14739 / NCIMB 2177 / R-4) TaxID=523841 RepID=PHAE_HALMT|nr:poly(R)-hydroxyalkanoic acid synthase subunit PhaE [Haloferax mediterranei]I3R9Z3.1 RecName: Full=Poly(3-hydroxyalkanoate) polymerase subunit PhaE; Short=PHA polymerase; AltName: Full=PHB synthase subunit PhaE; AltName: Full=Poly(3-hydroxybutyrate) polymerase subunit PhaE; Short=PHB polymerase; AltName: Full=Polyhydroxyalkanoic acid synthase subunit PhaE; Short=PHA synthase [Haloferax mediterranei ATCC 33500]ACB10369.1 PhaE [Haloferax mediterranei]AFK21053.1 poly(3-hydroxyalkanoate) synthase 